VRVLPYGPGGWLVETGEDDVGGYAAAVRRAGRRAVAEVVPAARTVLVRVGDPDRTAEIGAWLATLAAEAVTSGEVTAQIEVPVGYDGEDLGDVAAACGLTPSDVIERHTAATYVCAFVGFAPGFAYLTGLDPSLHLPRRTTPRPRVPAGAVGIAAGYTGVYPAASPGGWHLIGHTDLVMWDPGRDPPAAIGPGATVRFVAT
jgi:KipI family sensor histidine kinase inhibitor